MLDLVDVGERSCAAYRGIAPEPLLDELQKLSADLRGARVVHINATPYGGGVSELLRSLVPLLCDLGLRAEWRIITGDQSFFEVTKAIHNGLQGGAHEMTDREKATYLASARANAAAFKGEYDFVFMHDPQPAAVLAMAGKGEAHWIWRCHIDTSSPNPHTWEFLRPFLSEYDAAIFTMPEFIPPGFPIERVHLVPPAIDPLSPKNMPLDAATARRVLEWIGISLREPLVTQVSRFDQWKDPFGVIDAFELARQHVPKLQLALVGSLALDDPEGWDVYREIQDKARDDPQIHVFTNIVGVGNVEVNAFQALSNVIVQKSIREGFGLVVSESMWKGTPVIAGNAGGIPLQMADGVGGVLVDSVEACAAAMVELLRDRERAREIGARGRERVHEHFLLPRLALSHLVLMNEVASGKAQRRGLRLAERRDPACGLLLCGEPRHEFTLGDATYVFCSEYCRGRFAADPSSFLRHLHERLG